VCERSVDSSYTISRVKLGTVNVVQESGSSLEHTSCFDTAMASVESETGTQYAVTSASGAPSSGSREASRKVNKEVSVLQNPEGEAPVLHSCVLRLRVEDRLLAEDVRESLESSKDRFVANQLASQVEDLFIWTSPRPAPPSPLGTNTSSANHSSLVWQTRMLSRTWNLPSAAPFHLAKNSATSILQH
jgi:hypothetical protein